MNKKVFAEAAKKGIAAAKELDEPAPIKSVVEVPSSELSGHPGWIVRRATPPAHYDPKYHALLVIENLDTGKSESVILYLYNYIHSYHSNGKPMRYTLQYFGTMMLSKIPMYVQDALHELAATLAEARIAEEKKKKPAKPLKRSSIY